MADHKALYQEVILDHNRKPRNFGTLEHPSHHAEGHNPLCGDHIAVALELAEGRVDQIAFQGESCAICKASASMMTVAVKGRSLDEAQTLTREFLDMATGKLDVDAPNHIGRLAVFAGVRNLPTRVKCAILPWHTLQAAFNAQPSVSTEAGDDRS
ncbi:MAG: SUF system NifU family Fe-S cluster assembly protein [Methyloversatilis sp.]|jgi:nitrogen fixation NifU-like protein|nr:SUF system NifU family Fe-S cluster assembly protein [Methyloversatilis sp.]MBP6194350.1 SUF system NifU family Fe-S cluster assembly protein [Methyloversatilis sp.]MBP9117611.1 SUF system NifU family Fe-S cluster assembly protein [Methyloversatilis sp.]